MMITGLRAARLLWASKLLGCDMCMCKPGTLLEKSRMLTFSSTSFSTSPKLCVPKYNFDPDPFKPLSDSSDSGSQSQKGAAPQDIKNAKVTENRSSRGTEGSTNQSGFIKGFLFRRYKNCKDKYEKTLEEKFPLAFKVSRLFLNGVQDFHNDMIWYWRIQRELRTSPDVLGKLSLQELDIYMQMPKDILKLIPIMCSWIPVVGYAVCAVIFIFPRQFLTRHFWTPCQQEKFLKIELQKRLAANRSILSYLQDNLKTVNDPFKYFDLVNIFAIVSSGHASPYEEDLYNVRDLFIEPPFSLESLKSRHIRLLSVLHGLRRYRLFNDTQRLKLKEHAKLIHYMDMAIERDGGVESLSLETLQRACAIRGLNPIGMTKEDMRDWLQEWIYVTTSIDQKHVSLLLHLPLLLGFNHPNNATLNLKENPNRPLRKKFSSM